MLDKVYRNCVVAVQLFLVWSLITCCLVGAWTIYSQGKALLRLSSNSEPKTIIISGGGK